MADAHDRPAVQMLNQAFAPEELKKHAALATYFEEGGSIFPLIEKGVSGLVREYNLDPVQARQLLRRANSMATYLRRQFIEHTLAGERANEDEDDVARQPFSGLLSIVPGPSYQGLFDPSFEQLTPPQSLEAITSPVAYLMELLRWIEQRIDPEGVAEEKYPYHERRTDIKQLSVDDSAVHSSVSAVDIIVPVLEAFIRDGDPGIVLDDKLLEARYPNGLPYYQHWVTLDGITRHNSMSVGHLVQRTDLQFPYFLQTQAWDADLARALAHASRLGPYQRTMLSEALVEHAARIEFYEKNFGTENTQSVNLNQVPFFGERTKLDSEQIEALFSVRGYAPVRSPNVNFDPAIAPELPENWRSGSVYLNANESPGVSITFTRLVNRLSLDSNAVKDVPRFDRINRKIRLDNWLQLPSEQTDALLVAAINAEARGTTKTADWQISNNVIHALGLFQALREHHQCTAEDFAAFIDTISVYGRGDRASHFDRVFNNQGNYSEPLKLDNGLFPVLPQAGVTDLTVNQLCSGLGIDLQTYQYLAVAIAEARRVGDAVIDQLPRNASVISSFYRLVKLPRLLGITPVEGMLMLTLLGGEDWLKGLAGDPVIDESSQALDVLCLMDALETCIEWCRERDLPVLWVLQHVATPEAANVLSEQDQQLLEKIGNLIEAALFSDARLQMAGVPMLPSASWLDLLSGQYGAEAPLVDSLGLVLAFNGSEEQYRAFAINRLEKAVNEGLGDIDPELRATVVEKMLRVLLQVRQAQTSVVKESLAVYAGVAAEPALAVLHWANSDVYQLLRQVLEADDLDDGTVVGPILKQDPLLILLADVRRRSAVVAKLDLSAALLQDYLDYGHKAWLGQADKHAFSMSTLYYLSVLVRAFGLSELPQQKLLDYLRQVNHLPDDLGSNAKALVQQAAAIRLADFFGWSVQEVRECIERMKPEVSPPEHMILTDLKQLDLLTRIRVLSTRTNMDALTLFLIGKLPEGINQADYAAAAEHALLSVTETAIPPAQLDNDLKKLVTVHCVVEPQVVVARKPGEKAIFTVTLRDASNQPLSGIPVYWQSTLGTIISGTTDTNGVLNAQYTPGRIQGTETPMFWLNLMDPQFAPAVSVSYDALSLAFIPDFRSPLPAGPVGLGQEVEVYATLFDQYSNLGPNSLVRWEYENEESNATAALNIRPQQSYTNQDGLARVFVSSTGAGSFTLIARSEASANSIKFDPITFQSDEPDA